MADGHQGVWPGKGLVLVPPPLDDVGHVEPEQECHLLAHAAQVPVKIVNHLVKVSPEIENRK